MTSVNKNEMLDMKNNREKGESLRNKKKSKFEKKYKVLEVKISEIFQKIK